MSSMLNAAGFAQANNSGGVDLSGSWDSLWSGIESATGGTGLMNLLAVIGVAIVVLALIKWVWDRRRGGGMGNTGAIWGSLLVGVLLSAPTVLIPALLLIVDAIVNALIAIWNARDTSG